MDFNMRWLTFCCLFALISMNDKFVFAFLWWSPYTPSCDDLPEYKNIINTLQHHRCTSDTQMWQLLLPLQQKSHSCLQQLISNLAGYVEDHKNNRAACHCTHDFEREQIHTIGYNHDHYWACVTSNPNCEYLFNYFYLRSGQTHETSKCQSSDHVWEHLRDVRSYIGIDVQLEIILHLTETFSKGHENVCTCRKATNQHLQTTLTTQKVDIPTSEGHTFASATSPPHMLYPTKPVNGISQYNSEHSSTPFPIHQNVSANGDSNKNTPSSVQSPHTVDSHVDQHTDNPLNITTNCEKFKSVTEIAAAESVSHPLAYLCQSGSRTSNEAYVLVNCKVGSPQDWKEGPNVMANCASIPTYTPVATFRTGYAGVHDNEALSGIFLGCVKGGFKIAFQNCDTHATIKHLEIGSGSGVDDPNNYFVIL